MLKRLTVSKLNGLRIIPKKLIKYFLKEDRVKIIRVNNDFILLVSLFDIVNCA